jgi:phosphoglycolate phosphatase
MRSGAAAIRAAIIDLDGTMLDTVPDFELALNGMRFDLGLAPIGIETIKPMIGKGSEKLVRDVLALDLPEGQAAALRALGLRLACVTNKPVAFARPLLAQHALASHFELLYGGDSLPKKKPDPLPLLQVCRDFDLLPAQVVAIGDSSNDAEAARAAGCFVLTVPYGYNHGQPVHKINSDGIVDTLLHAARLIEAHNRATN